MSDNVVAFQRESIESQDACIVNMRATLSVVSATLDAAGANNAALRAALLEERAAREELRDELAVERAARAGLAAELGVQRAANAMLGAELLDAWTVLSQ